ncbi:3-oxoacid CoA-transferase subunit A [Polynucleobacter sp. MWH-Aus1W21]|uniref:3-oxoacid CoA-transferase subunit A n=1 Tax=Polynucleobacter sp. MWH-Aus1W21 TaxID=1855880 RepID=UPI001BFEA02F|nr:3-oxoacid CoA-transferase subunit A [Polynucleobacter sp. MWH-Aus1W21]QWD66696.1 3-oxoacid CoA-transferase subunit A [Polynucleobacter sp. MWH-Aus1W21]
MIQKIMPNVTEALRDIADGSTILISGFGGAGLPVFLLDALLEQGAKELTLASNNAGNQGVGIAKLVAAGRVKKMICSFPRQPESGAFDDLYRQGKIELELVPQGTLAERIRAGGAGIGGFFTPTGFGTDLAKGKECREIDGTNYVFEKAIKADYALIKADKGDRWGNLIYHGTGRNFGPIMATAARCTIAQVNQVVELGQLDPEHIVTPGIFVKRVVLVGGKA